MTKLRLKQLDQDGANNGNLIKFNSATNEWEADDNVSAAPSGNDKGEASLATSGDDQETGVTIDDTPPGDSYVSVSVNGISYTVGDGVSNKDCYFGNRFGPSAIVDISSSDALKWNGTIAGFDLTSNDKIDLDYNINITGTTGGLVNSLTVPIEKKTVTSATDSVLFLDLDGDEDGEYYCTYKFKNDGVADAIYSMEPNQSSSNTSCFECRYHGGVGEKNARAYMELGICTSNYYVIGDFYFFADKGSGNVRLYTAKGMFNYNTFLWGFEMGGGWYDTTTTLISLDFVSDIANGIGVGSEIVLYKLLRS